MRTTTRLPCAWKGRLGDKAKYLRSAEGEAEQEDSTGMAGFLPFLSAAFGWIYFLCWGASFYPQAILNWRRRSTSGTTVDFPFINCLGASPFSSPRVCFKVGKENP